MANVSYGSKIYGCRDIKITNLAGTLQEDLDAAIMLAVEVTFKEAVLEGDDVEKAAVALATGGEGEMSNGGISSAALAIMTGKTLTTSGSSPNEQTTWQLDAGDRMPYFKVYGRSLDDDSGDAELRLHKVKLNSLKVGAMENGNFSISEASFKCFDDGTNGVLKIVQKETAADVPSS